VVPVGVMFYGNSIVKSAAAKLAPAGPVSRHGGYGPRHIRPANRSLDRVGPCLPCLLLTRMERTGIEPVAFDLQIPDFKERLDQIRSVNAKLCRLREIEIGYSGTRFGTRFRLATYASRTRARRWSQRSSATYR
jgi:hypothetical protein